jgi:tRNA pseudouridine55 synthase
VSRRRGASGLSGILVVDKPAGLTSHDVVSRVRRLAEEGRVGHAGTLDPLATGLLCVLVGPATRLSPFLSGRDKCYVARISFGSATDTDDREGETIRTVAADDSLFEPVRATSLLEGFLGEIEQTPPAYSAIKVEGRTAHRVARAGGSVALAPRTVTVHEARLEDASAADRTWDVAFSVSKGTYIRALARDIGERAGSAAHLTALRRTASGNLSIGEACSLDDLERAAETGSIAEFFVDPVRALGFSTIEAPTEAVTHGVWMPARTVAGSEGQRFSIVAGNSLLGVYRLEGSQLRPDVVLSVPAEGPAR